MCDAQRSPPSQQLFRPLRVSLAHLLHRHAGSVWLGLSCRLGVAGSDHPISVWLSLTMPARCGLVCHASSVWPGLSCQLSVAGYVMPAQCGLVCHAGSVWPGLTPIPAQCSLVCHASSVWFGLSCQLSVAGSSTLCPEWFGHGRGTSSTLCPGKGAHCPGTCLPRWALFASHCQRPPPTL